MEQSGDARPPAKVIQLRPEPGDVPDREAEPDDARDSSDDGHADEPARGERAGDRNGDEREADNVIRFDRTEPPNSVA